MAKVKTVKAAGGMTGLLERTSRKSATSSKTTTPTITVPPAVAKLLVELVTAKREQKSLEARVSALQDQIDPEARKIREDRCIKDKTVHSSVHLVTDDGTKITYVQNSRFCKMLDETAGDPLRREFGNEFDRFFTRKTSLSLNMEMMNDEIAEKICAALGDEASKILVSETTIEPTDALRNDMIFKPVVKAQVERLQRDEGLVRPFAAAFRV
jgi:hypothetical protein